MNFYGAAELAASFRTVRKNTLTIANEIGEDQYGFRPTPDSRSVAQILTHITLAPGLQEQLQRVERRTTLVGFDFPTFIGKMIAEEQAVKSKPEIIAALTAQGDDFAQWLESLSDDFLAERVTYPAGMTPPVKTRFEMILGVKEHEMHHRGQLMVMQRLIGIVPHMTREMQARFASMQAGKS